jgi:hypothetical protein
MVGACDLIAIYLLLTSCAPCCQHDLLHASSRAKGLAQRTCKPLTTSANLGLVWHQDDNCVPHQGFLRYNAVCWHGVAAARIVISAE